MASMVPSSPPPRAQKQIMQNTCIVQRLPQLNSMAAVSSSSGVPPPTQGSAVITIPAAVSPNAAVSRDDHRNVNPRLYPTERVPIATQYIELGDAVTATSPQGINSVATRGNKISSSGSQLKEVQEPAPLPCGLGWGGPPSRDIKSPFPAQAAQWRAITSTPPLFLDRLYGGGAFTRNTPTAKATRVVEEQLTPITSSFQPCKQQKSRQSLSSEAEVVEGQQGGKNGPKHQLWSSFSSYHLFEWISFDGWDGSDGWSDGAGDDLVSPPLCDAADGHRQAAGATNIGQKGQHVAQPGGYQASSTGAAVEAARPPPFPVGGAAPNEGRPLKHVGEWLATVQAGDGSSLALGQIQSKQLVPAAAKLAAEETTPTATAADEPAAKYYPLDFFACSAPSANRRPEPPPPPSNIDAGILRPRSRRLLHTASGLSTKGAPVAVSDYAAECKVVTGLDRNGRLYVMMMEDYPGTLTPTPDEKDKQQCHKQPQQASVAVSRPTSGERSAPPLSPLPKRSSTLHAQTPSLGAAPQRMSATAAVTPLSPHSTTNQLLSGAVPLLSPPARSHQRQPQATLVSEMEDRGRPHNAALGECWTPLGHPPLHIGMGTTSSNTVREVGATASLQAVPPPTPSASSGGATPSHRPPVPVKPTVDRPEQGPLTNTTTTTTTTNTVTATAPRTHSSPSLLPPWCLIAASFLFPSSDATTPTTTTSPASTHPLNRRTDQPQSSSSSPHHTPAAPAAHPSTINASALTADPNVAATAGPARFYSSRRSDPRLRLDAASISPCPSLQLSGEAGAAPWIGRRPSGGLPEAAGPHRSAASGVQRRTTLVTSQAGDLAGTSLRCPQRETPTVPRHDSDVGASLSVSSPAQTGSSSRAPPPPPPPPPPPSEDPACPSRDCWILEGWTSALDPNVFVKSSDQKEDNATGTTAAAARAPGPVTHRLGGVHTGGSGGGAEEGSSGFFTPTKPATTSPKIGRRAIPFTFDSPVAIANHATAVVSANATSTAAAATASSAQATRLPASTMNLSHSTPQHC